MLCWLRLVSFRSSLLLELRSKGRELTFGTAVWLEQLRCSRYVHSSQSPSLEKGSHRLECRARRVGSEPTRRADLFPRFPL